MRIGIDCRFAVEARPRGTGLYIQHLIKHLASLDTDNNYVFYVHHAKNIERLPQSSRIATEIIPSRLYPVWEQALLPVYAKKDHLDVMHCAGSTGPLFLPQHIGYVVTVHDVSFLLPEPLMPKPRLIHQRLGRLYRRWVVPRAARRAGRVVAVSHYTAVEIVRMTAVDLAKVRVVYHGLTIDNSNNVATDICFERMRSLPERYVLCLGGNAPHKNVERVIRVFASLAASGRHQGCALVILGVQQWRDSPYWRQAVASGCEGQIHFIDFISDNAELAALYHRAFFVLSPSLNESFGFPALEAMACGVPVITSNVAAIPEIVGDAALLIDPRSDDSMEHAILAMLSNASLRRQFIARGYAHITRFSWQHAATEMLQIYKEVAGT